MLTSVKFKSKLRQTTLKALKDFKWVDVIAEWGKDAPIFKRFLESASSVPKDLHPPKKTLKPRAVLYAHRKKCTMAMAGATLIRARCPSMTAHMY